MANDQVFAAIRVTVDNRAPVDLLRRRFELVSPQRTIELPGDNVLDAPPGPATFTAHAWGAVIRSLRPGRHTVTLQVLPKLHLGDPFTATIRLNVARDGA